MAFHLAAKSSRILCRSSPHVFKIRLFSSNSNIELSVLPKKSLVDDRNSTRISNLTPEQKVTLKLSVTNKTNLNYASVTHFQADSSGVVDLSEALPSCKSYAQPDPMAIYWTMKPQEGSDERFWALNIPNGLFCTYEVFQDHLSMDQTKVVQPLVSDEVKKDYMGPGVTREEIRDGRVVGTLYMPPGPGPHPAVINIYGGIHKGNVIEDKSAVFASRGFASLALAFFGVPGLPKSYATQPMDMVYFEEAADYLLQRPDIKSDQGVGFAGISKGGEIALAIASCVPETKISAIAALNTVINFGSIPVYYRGEKVCDGWFSDLKGYAIVGDNLVDISPIVHGYKEKPEALIPFTKSKANLLMIGGNDDRCCLGGLMTEHAEILMKEAGKTNFECCTYPGLGHLIDLPFFPPTTITNHALLPKGVQCAMGGDNLEQHGNAQEQVWTKLLQYFDSQLN